MNLGYVPGFSLSLSLTELKSEGIISIQALVNDKKLLTMNRILVIALTVLFTFTLCRSRTPPSITMVTQGVVLKTGAAV